MLMFEQQGEEQERIIESCTHQPIPRMMGKQEDKNTHYYRWAITSCVVSQPADPSSEHA